MKPRTTDARGEDGDPEQRRRLEAAANDDVVQRDARRGLPPVRCAAGDPEPRAGADRDRAREVGAERDAAEDRALPRAPGQDARSAPARAGERPDRAERDRRERQDREQRVRDQEQGRQQEQRRPRARRRAVPTGPASAARATAEATSARCAASSAPGSAARRRRARARRTRRRARSAVRSSTRWSGRATGRLRGSASRQASICVTSGSGRSGRSSPSDGTGIADLARGLGRASCERPGSPRPGLVERQAERVDVRLGAGVVALGLLGRHVGEGADDLAGRRSAWARRRRRRSRSP